jgi:hypothetical protein
MDRYERARVADALVDSVFSSGEAVIREGDSGDRFYLVRPYVDDVLTLSAAGDCV